MKVKAILSAAFVAAAVGAAAVLQTNQASTPDADQVREEIATRFLREPLVFSIRAASAELAAARLDGFAVCTQASEATSAQYVEVAGFLDKPHEGFAFKQAVDAVMTDPSGMSDCDFRVLTIISNAASRG